MLEKCAFFRVFFFPAWWWRYAWLIKYSGDCLAWYGEVTYRERLIEPTEIEMYQSMYRLLNRTRISGHVER